MSEIETDREQEARDKIVRHIVGLMEDFDITHVDAMPGHVNCYYEQTHQPLFRVVTRKKD